MPLKIDRRTGKGLLNGNNPYKDLSDRDLANAAGALSGEALDLANRSAAERLQLAERISFMLIACNYRLFALIEAESVRKLPPAISGYH